MMDDNYIEENYTFSKTVLINNEIESTIDYDFHNKAHIVEVLQSVLLFLRASGFDYIDELVAKKGDGEMVSSNSEISDDLMEILDKVIIELDSKKAASKKPKLEVVSSNDNTNTTDSS